MPIWRVFSMSTSFLSVELCKNVIIEQVKEKSYVGREILSWADNVQNEYSYYISHTSGNV